MSKTRSLLTLVSALGLLGCGHFGDDKTIRTVVDCNPGGVCLLKVRVSECKVTVPEELTVYGRGVEKPIIWQIDPRDPYRFAANGVVIFADSSKTAPAGDFVQPTLAGKVFIWNDKHTTAGRYPYTVHVVGTGADPQACPPHDPFINNR